MPRLRLERKRNESSFFHIKQALTLSTKEHLRASPPPATTSPDCLNHALDSDSLFFHNHDVQSDCSIATLITTTNAMLPASYHCNPTLHSTTPPKYDSPSNFYAPIHPTTNGPTVETHNSEPLRPQSPLCSTTSPTGSPCHAILPPH